MPKRINIYSNRGQGVLLVLYSLHALEGACTKQEVLTFIQNADFYEITRYDLAPYPGHDEPQYHTLLAWARKDALIAGWLVDRNERDAWQLSRGGREIFERTMARFRKGELRVSECYLWTPKFKSVVDPAYKPSPNDRIRPDESLIEYTV